IPVRSTLHATSRPRLSLQATSSLHSKVVGWPHAEFPGVGPDLASRSGTFPASQPSCARLSFTPLSRAYCGLTLAKLSAKHYLSLPPLASLVHLRRAASSPPAAFSHSAPRASISSISIAFPLPSNRMSAARSRADACCVGSPSL